MKGTADSDAETCLQYRNEILSLLQVTIRVFQLLCFEMSCQDDSQVEIEWRRLHQDATLLCWYNRDRAIGNGVLFDIDELEQENVFFLDGECTVETDDRRE